ncbi:NADH:ubiquinone oxidoreductase 11 kDa subunit [Chytriomyces sp. MP71]|nr:NADH:ubiquinone oxidoreductase 11 kDa subunit [Chytriomyces sp. MP71]
MSTFSRFPSALKELRIHVSQTAAGSKGARDFVLNHYAAIKAANPSLPILVREATNVEARVFGRYAQGVERKIVLENLDEASVAKKIREIAETAPSKAQS